jgi:hypothetical protein
MPECSLRFLSLMMLRGFPIGPRLGQVRGDVSTCRRNGVSAYAQRRVLSAALALQATPFQNSTYLITNRSVIALSTRVRSFSNSASDRVDPIFINGNSVTVRREKGFGTANPSQELNRQYAEYSISKGKRGT